MVDVDVYPGNYRTSPQQQPQAKVAPNARVDALKHNSSSQPDLINRRPEPNSREDLAHLTVHSAIPASQLQDQSRYGGGLHMKGAASNPNVSTEAQKGFQRMPEDADHQRILEWQQRNQMLAEREHWEQSRSSGAIHDGAKGSVANKEFSGLMRPEFSSGGRAASLDDERGGYKLEQTDVAKQPIKPILPFQSQQQAASKKGPGYATQMLFPAAQPKPQQPRDGAAGYQAGNQQPGVYAPGKPPQGYGSGVGSLPSNQGDGFQNQPPPSFPTAQPRNFQGNVQPRQGGGGPYVAPLGSSSTSQHSEYRPISEFSRGYGPASSPVGDATRMRNTASLDADFPPPPSDLHLAQLGAKTPTAGEGLSTRPGGLAPSIYNQQPAISSVAPYGAEKADKNSRLNEHGKFLQGDRQPASMYGYQEYSSGYPQRPDDMNRSTQGPGSDIYQSRLDSSSSIAALPVGGPRVAPQPQAKKPPPIAAKPKVVGMGASVDVKPYGSSQWDDREAKDKQRDEEVHRKRQEEIKRLQNRPYRSPEEQSKLQRLLTEEEFDRRAQEASEEKDSEEDASEVNARRRLKLDGTRSLLNCQGDCSV